MNKYEQNYNNHSIYSMDHIGYMPIAIQEAIDEHLQERQNIQER